VPSDTFLKAANALHRIVQKATFGKLGWSAGPMAVIELTTTGRKSGQPRTVLLTSPVQEGESILIVASRGGDDQHPAWFLNLQADPVVQVRLKGGPKRAMTARIVTGEDRERLWPLVTAAYRGYAGYQKRTSREIPLVFLDP
jgi:deazaflavin-dependent oxidoreductase (nitroreductase family)